MADQFCRIVDTTLTHTTLGADSAQTILTTDANTSYIIRDVFQKNSESNEKLKMTGSLVMNDVTVTGGITSSASGSLIVPPSTTLCYVDTSGNYPLDYQNVYMYPDVKAQCHNNCKLVVCTCTVNGVSSGSANVAPVNTTSYWGAVNSCNFYAGGFWLQDPDSCNYVFYCADGNSTQTLRIFCCSGTSGCHCCNMSYCVGTWKDGIFMNFGGSYYQSWFPGCYQACCGPKCYINPVGVSHCGATTYSSFGMSSRLNNDFHCRLTVFYPGSSSSHVVVGYVDMTNCAYCLIYCAPITAQSDCWCNMWYDNGFNPQPYVLDGVPYVGTFDNQCFCYATFSGVCCRNVTNAISMPSQFKCQKSFEISNGRVFGFSFCDANDGLFSVDVKDLMDNGETATVTTHFACDASCCCSIADYQGNQPKVYYNSISSPNPSNFTLNPSTKLVAYGIKST